MRYENKNPKRVSEQTKPCSHAIALTTQDYVFRELYLRSIRRRRARTLSLTPPFTYGFDTSPTPLLFIFLFASFLKENL